jgi:uncharacterized membrane protein YbhN (UPF0104 family)
MIRAAGGAIGLRDAVALTAVGDAAAAVTPWRAGGEAGRVMGAQTAGVAFPVIAAGLAIETVVGYAVATSAGALLCLRYGSDWLVRARSNSGTGMSLPLVFIVAALAVGAIAVARSMPSLGKHARSVASNLVATVRAVRRVPPRAFAWCAALSLLSLVARIAVFPLLAVSLADAPAGIMVLVSFMMVHSQIAMPTPAGVGAIDLAILGGEAGIATHAAAVLVWWRVYMTVIPIVVGFTIGTVMYGRLVWRLLPRGRSRAAMSVDVTTV